jgi:hypothetical protein
VEIGDLEEKVKKNERGNSVKTSDSLVKDSRIEHLVIFYVGLDVISETQ